MTENDLKLEYIIYLSRGRVIINGKYFYDSATDADIKRYKQIEN